MDNLPDKKALALRSLEKNKGYIGVTRDNNRAQVAHFAGVFGNGPDAPFCAEGSGFCDLISLADLTETPYTAENVATVLRGLIPVMQEHYWPVSASCGEIVRQAKAMGIWLSAADCGDNVDILPGWKAIYDWKCDGVADHIGTASEDDGDIIHDIEDNTSNASNANGGAVALRTRVWNCTLLGFVMTYRE